MNHDTWSDRTSHNKLTHLSMEKEPRFLDPRTCFSGDLSLASDSALRWHTAAVFLGFNTPGLNINAVQQPGVQQSSRATPTQTSHMLMSSHATP